MLTCGQCGRGLPKDGICPVCLLVATDPFELLEELGRGGMGTVFRAHHRGLDRDVAVKFLAAEGVEDPELRARLLREARLLARVSHPGVVQVHDVGESDGMPYVVMELVVGAPLSACLPLPPERIVALGLQATEALIAVHAAGVVHRDIKPDNLLIEPSGRLRLVDFGIARSQDVNDGRLTRTGHYTGTPAYLAPEVGQGAPPDPRQDLFALGVTLAQALTGAPPGGVMPRGEGPLARIIERATAPLDQRYADAAAMRTDLEAAAAALRSRDRLSGDERTWRRIVALALTACTGVVLAAGLVSLTPKVLEAREVRPLVMFALQPLPDGRVVSWMRFEEGPTIASLVAIAAGAAVWMLVVRHWRDAGLVEHADGGVPQGRVLLLYALFACSVAVVRRIAEPYAGAWFAAVPLFGGFLEIGVLWLFWNGLLETTRTGRAIPRQWALWGGLWLGLLPPIATYLEYLRAWHP